MRPHTPPLVPASMKPMPSAAERLGAAHAVAPVGVAAVDHDVARARAAPPRLFTVSSVGSPAGTITHTRRGGGQRGDQLLEGGDVGGVAEHVVADDLVAVGAEPLGHVPAHAPEPHHAELHDAARRAARRGRRGRRGCPRAWRVRRSPAAWACLRWPKPKGWPGMSISFGSSPTTWTHTIGARPALVELARGVEEPRAEPEAGGDAVAVAQRDARRLEAGRPAGRPGRRRPGGRGGRRAGAGRGGRRAAARGPRRRLRRAPRRWRPWRRPRRAGRRAARRWRRRRGRRPAPSSRPCGRCRAALASEPPTIGRVPGRLELVDRAAGRGRGGRRRRPAGAPSGSLTIGTAPVPSLPSDSATSCSIHRPMAVERGIEEVGDLVAADAHAGGDGGGELEGRVLRRGRRRARCGRGRRARPGGARRRRRP